MRCALVRVGLALALLCAATSITACGDATTGPSRALGIYVLRSVDGQTLPYVLFASGGDTTSVLDESLSFSTGGHATRITRTRSVVNGGAAQLFSSTESVAYTVDGVLIAVQTVCPPNASCVAPEHGTISETELALSHGSGTPVWRYARLTVAVDQRR